MQTCDPPLAFAEERREMETVLSSELLGRAPALCRMLRFVCAKYFAGEAGRIREYSVAVEALGRPADFNPKRDPIVRVEAHRLRKRLAEYYAAEGAAHELELILDPGQYVPRFERRIAPPPEPAPPPRPRRSFAVFLSSAAALLLAVALLYGWVERGRAVVLPHPSGGEIRLLAGVSTGGPVPDDSGNFWSHDQFYRGGVGAIRAAGAFDFTRPERFGSQRQGVFSYDIPLHPGRYQLRLYFGDLAGGRGVSNPLAWRRFPVAANGVPLMDRFRRIASPCNPQAPVERVFDNLGPASDGSLHLRFGAAADPAYVDALEVVPVPGDAAPPIRFVAKNSPYIDAAGAVWSADEACGGKLVSRWDSVSGNHADPNLFSGERYGAFTYSIPAGRGKYRAILRFAENWFGPDRPGGGGVGSRVFDVFLNGRPVVRGLDIYARAGGSLRPLTLAFDGVEPDADGQFFFQFIPQTNYAMINSLEILGESR